MIRKIIYNKDTKEFCVTIMIPISSMDDARNASYNFLQRNFLNGVRCDYELNTNNTPNDGTYLFRVDYYTTLQHLPNLVDILVNYCGINLVNADSDNVFIYKANGSSNFSDKITMVYYFVNYDSFRNLVCSIIRRGYGLEEFRYDTSDRGDTRYTAITCVLTDVENHFEFLFYNPPLQVYYLA